MKPSGATPTEIDPIGNGEAYARDGRGDTIYDVFRCCFFTPLFIENRETYDYTSAQYSTVSHIFSIVCFFVCVCVCVCECEVYLV